MTNKAPAHPWTTKAPIEEGERVEMTAARQDALTEREAEYLARAEAAEASLAEARAEIAVMLGHKHPDGAEHSDSISYVIRRGETDEQAFRRAARAEVGRLRVRAKNVEASLAVLKEKDLVQLIEDVFYAGPLAGSKERLAKAILAILKEEPR